MKNIVFVLIAILLLQACSNKSKEVKNKPVLEEVKEVKNEFIVKLNFITNKEDIFKLTLNKIKIDEFQSKNILITEQVAPSTSYEELTANFGENISKDFRINFGNKEEKDIQIKTINLSYGSKNISINSNEIKEYFTFNKYITQDTITYKFQTKMIDGKHYPQIILKRKTIESLVKE